MKVFLGGTCDGYDWRKQIIPLLECDYYNPIVENWTEEDRQREVKERETSDFVLYTITSGIKGVYSIAEVTDDSNKRPEKTLFCILTEGMNDQMKKSIEATTKLIENNGAKVFFDLHNVASYINLRNVVDSI